MSWDYNNITTSYIDVYNTTNNRGYMQQTPSAARNDFATSTLRYRNGLIGPGLNNVNYLNPNAGYFYGVPMQYRNTVLRRRWTALSGCSACQGSEANYYDDGAYNWICRLTFNNMGGYFGTEVRSPYNDRISDRNGGTYRRATINITPYIIKQNWCLQDDGETSIGLYSPYYSDDIDIELNRQDFSFWMSSCRGFSETWVDGNSRTDINTSAQHNDKGWMIWLYIDTNAKAYYTNGNYTFFHRYPSAKHQRRYGILCTGGTDTQVTYNLARQAAERIQSNVNAAQNANWFNQDRTWSQLMDMITAGTWIDRFNKGFGVNAPKLWREYTGNLIEQQREWDGTPESVALYEPGHTYPRTDEISYIGNNYTNLLSFRRKEGLRKVGEGGQTWDNVKCDFSSWMNFSACCSSEGDFSYMARGSINNYQIDVNQVNLSGERIYDVCEQDILYGTGNWPIGGYTNYSSSCSFMYYSSEWNDWCRDYKGWYGEGRTEQTPDAVTNYHECDEEFFTLWWKWNTGCYYIPGGSFTLDFRVKAGIIAYYPEVVHHAENYPDYYVGVSPS